LWKPDLDEGTSVDLAVAESARALYPRMSGRVTANTLTVLAVVLGLDLVAPVSAVVAWNDGPALTVAAAVDALRDAADKISASKLFGAAA
jgi:hypothetical protein